MPRTRSLPRAAAQGDLYARFDGDPATPNLRTITDHRDLLDRLRARMAAHAWAAKQFDDITLLAVRRGCVSVWGQTQHPERSTFPQEGAQPKDAERP